MDTRFDTIIVTCASGSTLGGMVAGFKLAEKLGFEANRSERRRVIGIQAMTQTKEEVTKLILDCATRTGNLLGLASGEISSDDFEIDGRFNAGQYGKLDVQTIDAMKELARLEGILTDPVYTGKAFTAMLHKLRAGEFIHSQQILFVHTGGQAAISAYPELK
jgi:1-aminocyclopropane-1-carboxylate deaminase